MNVYVFIPQQQQQQRRQCKLRVTDRDQAGTDLINRYLSLMQILLAPSDTPLALIQPEITYLGSALVLMYFLQRLRKWNRGFGRETTPSCLLTANSSGQDQHSGNCLKNLHYLLHSHTSSVSAFYSLSLETACMHVCMCVCFNLPPIN